MNDFGAGEGAGVLDGGRDFEGEVGVRDLRLGDLEIGDGESRVREAVSKSELMSTANGKQKR